MLDYLGSLQSDPVDLWAMAAARRGLLPSAGGGQVLPLLGGNPGAKADANAKAQGGMQVYDFVRQQMARNAGMKAAGSAMAAGSTGALGALGASGI